MPANISGPILFAQVGQLLFWSNWAFQRGGLHRIPAEAGQGATPKGTHAILPGSVEAALVRYYDSDMWQEQAKSTRDLRRPILEQFRAKYGTGKIRALQRSHVQQIIAARSASAQSNWMKCLRHFMT